MNRGKLSTLQVLEREIDRTIDTASKSAKETLRLSKAAFKSENELE